MAGAGLEVEIKLRVASAEQMARRLSRLGARSLGRVHERNTLFDSADNALGRSGRVLRVRSLEPAPSGAGRRRPTKRRGRTTGVLTFKTPLAGGHYKVRKETEVRIEPPERAEDILEGLGFRPWFRYEKFRTTYRLPAMPRLLIELDETPIGVFLELEGPPQSIDRVARRLGYGPGDYLRESYYELFEHERKRAGLPAGRMLFSGKKSRIPPLSS